ncbi:DUF397 domain-containing protein [Actinomadura xylanilytica]|uniref:DUF397 domain-containing protein n=1 Tax=Actinomadura xylanilytica TaxID=887459 RepID=UPI00255AC45D|nr:DUF397 domain-containing protein [Actinomadura xylanilytica]MDL4770825.1 DUF397 domain-containing protein [Actinomadura xylanilytica]
MTEDPKARGVPARKPTVQELGLDPDALHWRRSAAGTADGGTAPDPTSPDPTASGVEASGVEVAFAGAWVLLRTSGDPGALISVFDHHEWDCFLAGVKAEEFDRAAS